jgi:hypothetical protein
MPTCRSDLIIVDDRAYAEGTGSGLPLAYHTGLAEELERNSCNLGGETRR